MNKISSITIAFFMLFSLKSISPIAAQKQSDYHTLWEQVDVFEKQDLPESALKEIEKIATKAEKEGNIRQLVKVEIKRAKQQLKKDPYKRNEVISRLEKFATDLPNGPEKAIAHALLADLYFNCSQSIGRNVPSRSTLGETPKDIAEWTLNHFAQKVYEHLTLSIAEQDHTEKVSWNEFKQLLQEEENNFEGSLHDFLLCRIIHKGLNYASCYEPAYRQGYMQLQSLPFTYEGVVNSAFTAESDYDFVTLALQCYQAKLRQDSNDRTKQLSTLLLFYRTTAFRYSQQEQEAILDHFIMAYADLPIVTYVFCEKYVQFFSLTYAKQEEEPEEEFQLKIKKKKSSITNASK